MQMWAGRQHDGGDKAADVSVNSSCLHSSSYGEAILLHRCYVCADTAAAFLS